MAELLLESLQDQDIDLASEWPVNSTPWTQMW